MAFSYHILVSWSCSGYLEPRLDNPDHGNNTYFSTDVLARHPDHSFAHPNTRRTHHGICTRTLTETLGGLGEGHDAVAEGSAGIPPPHRAEGLKKGDAVAALGEGEGPEGGVLD